METSTEEQTTSTCGHCNRAIPAANIDLHYVHCSRNLEKCKVCEDMIPRKHAEEHYLSVHAPVSCSLCSETFERETLEVHKGESCPQRIVTCEYCEFPLPAVDLFKHQEVCGNRTELCNLCSKYIRLRERYVHEIQCNGTRTSERAAESSRDESVAAREREAERVRGIARARGAERRQPNGFFPKRLLCTIAITGIAVLLGSFFLQRKADSHQMQ